VSNSNSAWNGFQLLNYQISQSPQSSFMTEAELKSHLDAAEKGPKLLAAAVAGLPEATLRYKPSAEAWSIREIVGHLADVEIVYAFRIRQMLADTKPVIAPMDQNAWARCLGYMDTPVPEMIALFGVNRHHNLRLLRAVTVEDLKKGAHHPELKRDMTLEEMVLKLDGHSSSHLEQIEKLKKMAR
jgi:DinB superfamily